MTGRDRDELVDAVGEVLHRRGHDLSEDRDADLVRETVEVTADVIEATE